MSAKLGSLSIAIGTVKTGCPLIRGCLSIEVNGRTLGTLSVKRGSTV